MGLELVVEQHRWVWLGDHLPWEVYEKLYGQKLNNQNAGAGAKPARMVIAAMIVKHAGLPSQGHPHPDGHHRRRVPQPPGV